MDDTKLRCPQCGSRDLECDHLTVRGRPWTVVFGGTPFLKKELVAYACRDCDGVFFRIRRIAKPALPPDATVIDRLRRACGLQPEACDRPLRRPIG